MFQRNSIGRVSANSCGTVFNFIENDFFTNQSKSLSLGSPITINNQQIGMIIWQRNMSKIINQFYPYSMTQEAQISGYGEAPFAFEVRYPQLNDGNSRGQIIQSNQMYFSEIDLGSKLFNQTFSIDNTSLKFLYNSFLYNHQNQTINSKMGQSNLISIIPVQQVQNQNNFSNLNLDNKIQISQQQALSNIKARGNPVKQFYDQQGAQDQQKNWYISTLDFFQFSVNNPGTRYSMGPQDLTFNKYFLVFKSIQGEQSFMSQSCPQASSFDVSTAFKNRELDKVNLVFTNIISTMTNLEIYTHFIMKYIYQFVIYYYWIPINLITILTTTFCIFIILCFLQNQVMAPLKEMKEMTEFIMNPVKNSNQGKKLQQFINKINQIEKKNEKIIKNTNKFNYIMFQLKKKINLLLNKQQNQETFRENHSQLEINEVEYLLVIFSRFFLQSQQNVLQSEKKEDLYKTNRFDINYKFKDKNNLIKLLMIHQDSINYLNQMNFKYQIDFYSKQQQLEKFLRQENQLNQYVMQMRNFRQQFKKKRIDAFINEKKVVLRSFNNQINRRKTIFQKKVKFIQEERREEENLNSRRNSFTLNQSPQNLFTNFSLSGNEKNEIDGMHNNIVIKDNQWPPIASMDQQGENDIDSPTEINFSNIKQKISKIQKFRFKLPQKK